MDFLALVVLLSNPNDPNASALKQVPNIPQESLSKHPHQTREEAIRYSMPRLDIRVKPADLPGLVAHRKQQQRQQLQLQAADVSISSSREPTRSSSSSIRIRMTTATRMRSWQK
uniref:(northern house mosquito) hypothetical protein n=1 Tax=Culex pipiens TaxID=7175 RepID=A0A8D8KNQ3_CULPI